MDGTERASSNLLLDHILVDAMFSSTVVLTCIVLGAGVQCFLHDMSVPRSCHDGDKLTFTGRLALGFRRRCLWGESYDADLQSVSMIYHTQ